MLKRNTSLLLATWVAAVVAGATATPARGQVASWGFNGTGQLGNGTFANGNTPGPVNTLTSGVTAIAGGGIHSLAIRNGALFSWGGNQFLQLGTGGGNATLPGAVPGFSSGVTAVAGGGVHTLAVQNGALFTWGTAALGELGGSTFGGIPQLPRATPTIASGVTAVAAGNQMSMVIQNGAVLSFGFNDVGQLGLGTANGNPNPVPTVIPTLASGVTQIDAMFKHAAAIRNGGLFAWGNNFRGQLGNGTNSNSSSPVAVNGMGSGVTDVSVGDSHSLAVLSGTAFAWGSNDEGQLGTGQFMPSTNVPVAVPGLPNNVIDVEALLFSSFALTADRRLFVWGENGLGELGDGTFIERYTPLEIFAPNGFFFAGLAGGGNHMLAILTPIPEPSSLLLMGFGSSGAAATYLRRRAGRRASA